MKSLSCSMIVLRDAGFLGSSRKTLTQPIFHQEKKTNEAKFRND
jgi:hypothetical protein